jgi:hypothetical protein
MQAALLNGLAGVLADTLAQGFVLVGAIVALAAAHGAVERASRAILTRTFGWWSVLWTGWIGVPVHEMSHLVMARIFRHHVSDLHLFSPDPRTGMLGYVNHTWKPESRYQRAGNFFIGVAPVLGGTAVLILLTRLILPPGSALDDSSRILAGFLASPGTSTGVTLARHLALELPVSLFSPPLLASWRLWLVLYLLMAVALHMSPSREDLRGTWKGFAFIAGGLLCINVIALPFGGIPESHLGIAASIVAPAAAALLLALVLNLAALVLVCLASWTIRSLGRNRGRS